MRRAFSAARRGYRAQGLPQQAAAISFRVLFSFVPLVALIVSLLQLVLPADVIDSFVSWLMGELAGSPEVEASVARALVGARGTATVVTFVALGALIWGASGMMSAMRYAFVGYGWYLTQISDVAVVYRSLAGLLGFLLVVYVGVLALLFGAELVASGAARV